MPYPAGKSDRAKPVLVALNKERAKLVLCFAGCRSLLQWHPLNVFLSAVAFDRYTGVEASIASP